MNQFDRYPTIQYNDSLRLWWDTYPIRVVLESQVVFQSKDAGYRPFYEERKRLRERIIPPNGEFWHTGTERGYNYFFTDPDVASQFIDANANEIASVDRPADFDQVMALKEAASADPAMASAKTVVRKTLYFGKYRYCVTFRTSPWRKDDPSSAEIDELVERMFFFQDGHPEDPFRVRYRYRSNRALYLRDQTDLVLLRLCLDSKLISKTMRVILQDEVESRTQQDFRLAA